MNIKKSIITVGIVLTLLVSISVGIWFTPYYYYIKIMTGKAYPGWFDIGQLDGNIYTPIDYQTAEILGDDSPFWRPFHIGNFKIRLSSRHPALVPMPSIELNELNWPILGIQINDANNRRLFTFRPNRIEVFQYGLSETPLLALPLSRYLLRERPVENVWKDLFARDLKEYKLPWARLLANLHILSMRKKYFPEKYLRFFYLEQSKLGVVELEYADKDFSRFQIMKLFQGKLVTFQIDVRKDHPLAKSFFEKFIHEIEYSQSYSLAADEVYKEFKTLRYEDKIGELGFLLLYSSYSHRPRSPAFFRELVRYLERQEKRPVQLAPLYQFGFNYFGSNFSTLEEERRETEEMALKRRMEEELEKELIMYEKMRLERGEFKDKKEKMDYQLQQAQKQKAKTQPKKIKGTVDDVLTFE